MIALVFILSLISAFILFILTISSLFFKTFQFWPPPTKSSWQYQLFWWLFRLVFAGIIVLSIIDFNGFTKPFLRFYSGLIMALIGFSLAFYLSFFLGWKNAHGEAKDLITTGWYAWSRNPIYLVSIIGFIGWALGVHSIYAYILFGFLISFYLLAPFLEEPWLERAYGEVYLNYKTKVPRFIGLPKR